MKLFAVITGDVIDSKKHPNSFETLKKSLPKIKTGGLYVPFSASRGDELQAVCSDPSLLPAIIRNLRYACRPLRLRVGIGIGAIENPNQDRNSWDMTGPAFILARDALDSVARNKNPRTVLASEDSFFDRAFNSIYHLIDIIISEWTDRQWEAVQIYETSRTYIKAASDLKIAWQNVQKRCQAAKWDAIKKAEEDLSALLKERFKNND